MCYINKAAFRCLKIKYQGGTAKCSPTGKATTNRIKIWIVQQSVSGKVPGVESRLPLGVVGAVRGETRAPALTPAVMKGVVRPRRRNCGTSITNSHCLMKNKKQREKKKEEKKQLWFLVFIFFPGAEPQAVFVVLENVTNTWCEIWKRAWNCRGSKELCDPQQQTNKMQYYINLRSLLRILDWTSAW